MQLAANRLQLIWPISCFSNPTVANGGYHLYDKDVAYLFPLTWTERRRFLRFGPGDGAGGVAVIRNTPPQRLEYPASRSWPD
ncbi:hypothetical protein TOC8171_28560 [Pseudomonas syringae]